MRTSWTGFCDHCHGHCIFTLLLCLSLDYTDILHRFTPIIFFTLHEAVLLVDANQKIAQEYSILKKIEESRLTSIIQQYIDGLFTIPGQDRNFFCTKYIMHDHLSSFFTFLSLHELLTYAELLLSVLASLHTIGIVHGRVLPDHVLHETFDRQTTLTGLGDAILIGEPMPRTSSHNLTPERVLTAKSDSWSAGVIIYMQLNRVEPTTFSSTNKWLC